MLNGILNVYKESGYTSNDVVSKLRGILHQKKIGHAGTLDPAATGVLPILLGSATKLSDMVMNHEKTYRAVLLLGVETDTQDMTGTVTAVSESIPGESKVREAVLSFIGGYEQLPPMYSAKKVDGKRLYALAREGKTADRKKVMISVTDIRIGKIDLPEVTFCVDCSKGTYIRTLCHDIGQKLGCGGAMKELTRTRAGGFLLEDALRLDQIQKLAAEGRIAEKIIPVEDMFPDCRRVVVPSTSSWKKLRNGNPLTLNELHLPPEGAGEKIRVLGADGSFAAVYRFDPDKRQYLPWKMFFNQQCGD